MNLQKQVNAYTLRNANGMRVQLLDYGATIADIVVPDRAGVPQNVVLGFDSPEDYRQPGNPYFGATIGRFANRIANGRFPLNGTEYRLSQNNHGHCLHGGFKGFDKVMWAVESSTRNSLILSCLSGDGEEGFPGEVHVQLTASIGVANELSLHYRATTSKPTPLSLTQHSYFNLSGGAESTVLNHLLQINADRYTEVDAALIPTGRLAEVSNGPLDFRELKPIGRDLSQLTAGYDHNFVLRNDSGVPAATVYYPGTGIQMDLFTTEPGLQVYTGNFLDGTLVGRQGVKYPRFGGFSLEPQQFPDAPNQPAFPSAILMPGETYQQMSRYKFSVR